MKFCETADGLLPGKLHSMVPKATKFARGHQRGAEGVRCQGSQQRIGLNGAPKCAQST